MISLGDAHAIAAFQVRSSLPGAAQPIDPVGAPQPCGGDFLAASPGIVSDLPPASRGLSAIQHAAQVLSHLCGPDAA